MPMTIHNTLTAENRVTPSAAEKSKILSNATAPEYRMTGRFKMEYIITVSTEKISRVVRSKRASISSGIVVTPYFR